LMQQRQLRLGDVLDDYCPRERRVTNHAIVAMVGSDVKQTRCTTCDTEHEYKGAKIPAQRKKKAASSVLYNQVLTNATKGAGAPPVPAAEESPAPTTPRLLSNDLPEEPEQASSLVAAEDTTDQPTGEEEGPVHRPLIRATLPRTEGTPPPVRQIPEFTIRQNGGRSGKFRASASHRHRPAGPGAHSGDGSRHASRSGMQGGRGGNRPSSPPHRPAPHPHGTRAARPGKKRSR
jgi:hypothetical protein